MKRYQSIFYITAIIFITVSGCTKKLDIVPLDQITSAAVWQDVSLMQAYVNDVYRGIGYGEFNSTSGMSVLTDEAIWTNGAKPIVQSTITPSNLDIIGGSRFSYLVWGTLYSYIRRCNMFLENTKSSTVTDKAQLDRLRGEIYFLRSYFYHNLMRVNGGVPIITQVYGLDDSTSIARNTFAETVDFIVKDADSAAALLPLSFTGADVGRATKGAALALKSRVLLYAASDLYNINPSGKPEFGYTDGGAGRTARWQAARDAAKAVMDMGIYKLYGADPAPGDSTAKNYSDLFLSKTNDEIIMNRFTSINNSAPNVAQWFSPNGYDGYGENSPIQQMVDAYEMKDGSKFSWNNPDEAAHPYENPTDLSNFLNTLAMLLLPFSLVLMYGRMLNQKRHSHIIFSVMLFFMISTLAWCIHFDTLQPNPALSAHPARTYSLTNSLLPQQKSRFTLQALPNLPVDQHLGNLEGKEIRFGTSAGATFAALTTATACGAGATSLGVARGSACAFS